MGKLFGTDGIRGVVGENLTVDLAFRTGKAIAAVLKGEKGRKPLVTIGKDTRISSDMIESALIAGLCAVGGDVMPLTLIKGLRQGGVTTEYNGEKPAIRHSEFKPEALQAVREGMYAVVNKPNGSGRRAKVKGLTICGKTGSAMLGKKTFAWFASYAPYEEPEVALAIVVENATSGGTDAAPIAGEIYKTYAKIRKTTNANDGK